MNLKRLIGAALGCALCFAGMPAKAADTIETGLLGAANAVEWPFYIGIHKGFFADAGVKLDVIYVPSPAGLVQQLAAGSLDICDIGVVEPIHAVARGASVAILRISGAVSPYAIVAKADIKTLKDLKGHTFIIGGLVDINRVYLERVLKAAGLKDADIDITVAGSTAARFAALKSGSADATMLAPPVNFFAEAAGFHSIGNMIDYTKDLPFGSTNVSRRLRVEASRRAGALHGGARQELRLVQQRRQSRSRDRFACRRDEEREPRRYGQELRLSAQDRLLPDRRHGFEEAGRIA